MILVDQALRDFMKVVRPCIRHPRVRFCQASAGFLMPSASPLRAREILRLATQILLRTLHVFRIRLLATIRFGQQILDDT